MSAQDTDYYAPTVSENYLDAGGNYISPARSGEEEGSGTLTGSLKVD